MKDDGKIRGVLKCKVLRLHFKVQNIKAMMKDFSEMSVNPWFPVLIKNFKNCMKNFHFIMVSLAVKKPKIFISQMKMFNLQGILWRC